MPYVIGVEWSEAVQDIEYTDAIENQLGEKSTMLPTNQLKNGQIKRATKYSELAFDNFGYCLSVGMI